MSNTRYAQFCALARAAEVVGERWTLLIVRELLLGPKRFSDLRERLDGISSSVLAEKLVRLEEKGVTRRTFLEPPAASTVYELTKDGQALRPTVFELIRWGARFLQPSRPGERVEPDWMRLALAAYARQGPVPERSFDIRIPHKQKDVVIHVRGGAGGTSVTAGSATADATVTTDVHTMLGLMAGLLNPLDAIGEGRIQAEGDLTALSAFPQLFDVQREGR